MFTYVQVYLMILLYQCTKLNTKRKNIIIKKPILTLPRGSTGGIRLCRKWNQYLSWFNWTSGGSSILNTIVWIQLVFPIKWS